MAIDLIYGENKVGEVHYKRYALMAIVAVALIIFGAAAWFYRYELGISAVVSAQEGSSKYAHIFSDEKGDDEIVAIVGANSENVITRGDIRVMAEFQIVHRPEISIEDALEEALVSRLNSAILYAEAVRLGQEPSDEELQAYMESIKAACKGPNGLPCRQLIKEQGYEDPDDYWEDAIAGYSKGMAIARMRQSYLDNSFPNDATEEEEEAIAEYERTLRRSADIDWKDVNLKEKYKLGLQRLQDLEPRNVDVPRRDRRR